MHDSELQKRAGCVWVLASGPVTDDDVPGILHLTPRPDVVVTADGGSTLAVKLGVTPNLIVGDLDSSDPDIVQRFIETGAEVRRYEHNIKSETDTELAVLAAIEWQPDRIVLIGATGGRLDHELANVLLLTHPLLAGTDLHIVDSDQEVFLAKPGTWNDIAGDPGDTVTLLPVGQDVAGVRTRGLVYPLHSEPLLEGRGLGVSNQIRERGAGVWLDAGKMLVVVLHLSE